MIFNLNEFLIKSDTVDKFCKVDLSKHEVYTYISKNQKKN